MGSRMKLLAGAILLGALPGVASASSPYEVEGGVITTLTSTGMYGATAYNTTGATISTTTGGVATNYLYLFSQEIDYENCPNNGDAIVAYRIPLNASGDPLDSTGKPAPAQRVGRINPCVPQPECTQNCTYKASFGPGQIFQATINGTTAFHLLADVSDWVHFYEIWHGWTTNGKDWTWEVDSPSGYSESLPNNPGTGVARTISGPANTGAAPFLKLDPSFTWGYLLNPVLMSTHPLSSTGEWWGYLKFIAGGQFVSTGMLVDWNGSTPTVSVLTGVSPSFTYTAIPNRVVTLAIYNSWYQLLPGRNVKSLLPDNASSGFQVWSDRPVAGIFGQYISCAGGTGNNATCPSGFSDCTGSTGCAVQASTPPPNGCATNPVPGCSCVPQGFVGDAFNFNTVGDNGGSTFVFWLATRYSISAEYTVGSTSRAMPSGYSAARNWPFRWNSASGKRYLFSSTNDANLCTIFLPSEGFAEQVVESQVTYHPGS
jgi:hypothetical protein